MSVKVEISGPVLSGAYFSCFHTAGDEEGLLLGNIREEIELSNSDEQIRKETTFQVYDVTRIALFSSTRLLYNKHGEINDAAIQQLVDESDLSVLGWCKMRQNSSAQMSMYEKIVSRNLNNKLHNNKQYGGSLFCLFTADHDRISTPVFTQNFFQVKHSSNYIKYEKIIPHIRNIGKTSSDYKTHSNTNTSTEYSTIVNQHKFNFQSGEGINFSQNIDKLAQHLNTTLKEKAQSLAHQESELAELRYEIVQLRQLALQSILEDNTVDTPIEATSERIPVESDDLDQVLTVTDSLSALTMSADDDPLPGQINLIDLEAAISDENSQMDNSRSTTNEVDSSLYPDKDREFQGDSFEHIELPPAETSLPNPTSSKPADTFSFVSDMMNTELSSFSPVRTPKVKTAAKS